MIGENSMNYVAAKCTQCGASINIDSSKKSGYCPNCGTKYFTKDVTINNYSSYTYNESIDGKTINRQAVLEKLLVNYYNGKFNDIDNLKEYSFKVLEVDKNNELANFIAFKELSDKKEIVNLLKSMNLKIGFELLLCLLNIADISSENIATLDFNKITSGKLSDKYLELQKVLDSIKKFPFVNCKIYLYPILKINFSSEQKNELIGFVMQKFPSNRVSIIRVLDQFASQNKGFVLDQKYLDMINKQKDLKMQLEEKKEKEQERLNNQKKESSLNVNEKKGINKDKKFRIFDIFKKKK